MQRLPEDQKSRIANLLRFMPEFQGKTQNQLLQIVNDAEDNKFSLAKEITGEREEETEEKDKLSPGIQDFTEHLRNKNKKDNALAGRPLGGSEE